MTNSDVMKRTAIQWTQARDIIRDFLLQAYHRNGMQDDADHNAAAILARLASATPPILICYAEELND